MPAANPTRSTRRRPESAGVADQQHRARAIVVDTEVAVGAERHAGGGGAALDEGGRRFTDEGGGDTLIGVLSDAVAAGQEQTAATDADPAVDVDDCEAKAGKPRGFAVQRRQARR